MNTEIETPKRIAATPAVGLHGVVKPHPLQWKLIHPSEDHIATQLWIKDEVLGLYWHLNNGFKRTAGNKIYAEEIDAQRAILHSSITNRIAELKLLNAELVRLNNAITIPDKVV